MYLEKEDKSIRYHFLVPWSKMIKKELIEKNDIKFEEIMFTNDQNFSVKVGTYAKEIAVSEEIIYCVTQDKGSLTTDISLESFQIRYEATKRRNDFLKKNNLKKYQAGMIDYILTRNRIPFAIRMKVLKESLIRKDKLLAWNHLEALKSPNLIIKKILYRLKLKKYEVQDSYLRKTN